MSSVVVLDTNLAYVSEVNIKKVLKWLIKGKVSILKSDESRVIRSAGDKKGAVVSINAPLVVQLLKFFGWKATKESIGYSDNAVYERDRNICQYWHKDEKGRKFKYRCTSNERTIDHVIPKSLGGGTSFENCVCCCEYHNVKVKKNRLAKDVGLELIRNPETPHFIVGEKVIINFNFNPQNRAHKAFLEYCNMQFSHVV